MILYHEFLTGNAQIISFEDNPMLYLCYLEYLQFQGVQVYRWYRLGVNN